MSEVRSMARYSSGVMRTMGGADMRNSESILMESGKRPICRLYAPILRLFEDRETT